MPTGNEYSAVILVGQSPKSGEYGQVSPSSTLGQFTSGDDMIPDPVPSKQFSSDKEADPKVLIGQTLDCIEDHADMNQAYGLNQPMATLGSHPWLRDQLANTSEKEPGNAQPAPGLKSPERG